MVAATLIFDYMAEGLKEHLRVTIEYITLFQQALYIAKMDFSCLFKIFFLVARCSTFVYSPILQFPSPPPLLPLPPPGAGRACLVKLYYL